MYNIYVHKYTRRAARIIKRSTGLVAASAQPRKVEKKAYWMPFISIRILVVAVFAYMRDAQGPCDRNVLIVQTNK